MNRYAVARALIVGASICFSALVQVAFAVYEAQDRVVVDVDAPGAMPASLDRDDQPLARRL